MHHFTSDLSRRRFLACLATGAASLPALKAFAEEWARFVEDGHYAQQLIQTPWQTPGPFYPDKLPLDQDNDLVLIGGHGVPADGEVTHLSGRILDLRGRPLKNALIEIWQVDSSGAYLHSHTDNASRRDKSFQGYGKFLTDSSGQYRFRTIKPVPYADRPPHIHFRVSRRDEELLTTQCYVKGHPRLQRDGIVLSVRDARARDTLIVPFEPLQGSRVGELQAKFNIVLGLTAED